MTHDTVPLLEQIGLPPSWLAAALREAGRAVRATSSAIEWLPLVLEEFSIERFDSQPIGIREPTYIITDSNSPWLKELLTEGRQFYGETAGKNIVYIWRIDRDKKLAIRISRTDDLLLDVVLATPHAQSINDREECRLLAQEGYDSARPLPLGRPLGPIAIELDWEPELLTVRVGPVPKAHPPRIRVHFHAASGIVVEVVEPNPLWHRNGCWEYEL